MGPLLYLIYINNGLEDSVSSSILKFADDNIIFSTISSVQYLQYKNGIGSRYSLNPLTIENILHIQLPGVQIRELSFVFVFFYAPIINGIQDS